MTGLYFDHFDFFIDHPDGLVPGGFGEIVSYADSYDRRRPYVIFSAQDFHLGFHNYMILYHRDILRYPLECLRCYKYSVEIKQFPLLRDKYPEIVGKAYLAIRMARRIRNWWTHIYYSPETDVGRRRLEREAVELVRDGILSEDY